MRSPPVAPWLLPVLFLILGLGASLSAQTAAPPPTAAAPTQMLQPGDQIRLRIWREEDLSRTPIDVDEQGTATFPKIGALRVTEMSPDSLKRLLVARYTSYLRNPSIEVTFLRRVRIMGAVRNPNLYYVEPTMTLADAIALAGGVSNEGRADRIELRRNGQKLTVTLTQETKIADSPIRSGDQIYVSERSWASRNAAIVAAGITAAALLGATLITH
jgi:protein involved in polysaccharide export with SLBB domain